MANPQAKTE